MGFLSKNKSRDNEEKTIFVNCIDCKHSIKVRVITGHKYVFYCPECGTTNVWEDYKPNLDEDDY